MRDWASSGAVKITRAKRHIENLDVEIRGFYTDETYRFFYEDEAETRDRLLRVNVRERLPLRWSAIIGDTIHNLRSALDILWRLVYPATVKSENRKDNFPIFDSPADYTTRFRRVVRSVDQRGAVIAILDELQPYRGGNDALWLLGELNNIDKHDTIIPAAALISRIRVDRLNFVVEIAPGMLTGLPDFLFSGEEGIAESRVFPMEDGAIVFRVPAAVADMNIRMRFELPFEIAFEEPAFAKGKPIPATLREFARTVEGVAETFQRAGLLT